MSTSKSELRALFRDVNMASNNYFRFDEGNSTQHVEWRLIGQMDDVHNLGYIKDEVKENLLKFLDRVG